MNTENQLNNNQALKFIRMMIFIGIFTIFLYSLKPLFWDKEAEPLTQAFSIISLCTLIAGSALVAGAFVGFIFAIPKSVSNSSSNMVETTTGYISNDNLVQVSDWLTKIIVGVGLTKLTQIPSYIMSMGKYIGASIGGGIWGEVAAESIIIYFCICGFLLAYLWTRLYFARLLEESEADPDAPANPPAPTAPNIVGPVVTPTPAPAAPIIATTSAPDPSGDDSTPPAPAA